MDARHLRLANFSTGDDICDDLSLYESIAFWSVVGKKAFRSYMIVAMCKDGRREEDAEVFFYMALSV